jgi:hypothetical protein
MTAFVRRGDRLALDVRCVTLWVVLLTEIREIELVHQDLRLSKTWLRNPAYTL